MQLWSLVALDSFRRVRREPAVARTARNYSCQPDAYFRSLEDQVGPLELITG